MWLQRVEHNWVTKYKHIPIKKKNGSNTVRIIKYLRLPGLLETPTEIFSFYTWRSWDWRGPDLPGDPSAHWQNLPGNPSLGSYLVFPICLPNFTMLFWQDILDKHIRELKTQICNHMQIRLKAPSFLNIKKVILCVSLFSAQLARKKKKKAYSETASRGSLYFSVQIKKENKMLWKLF